MRKGTHVVVVVVAEVLLDVALALQRDLHLLGRDTVAPTAWVISGEATTAFVHPPPIHGWPSEKIADRPPVDRITRSRCGCAYLGKLGLSREISSRIFQSFHIDAMETAHFVGNTISHAVH